MAKDSPIKPAAAAQQPVRPNRPNPQYLAKLQESFETKEREISRDRDKKG